MTYPEKKEYTAQAYEREAWPEDEMRFRAKGFLDVLASRRSVRDFSSKDVPIDVVKTCIQAAMTAPSGANKQPWTFAIVQDKEIKSKIRKGAEAEEAKFYGGRAPPSWLDDLAPLGTNVSKPFLENAPLLVVVFAQKTGPDGERHYYVNESVGIASGVLIAALHTAGLSTLTHTPSPMAFLNDILSRPKSEKPFLLLPVGYPALDCKVPLIKKKTLEQSMVLF